MRGAVLFVQHCQIVLKMVTRRLIRIERNKSVLYIDVFCYELRCELANDDRFDLHQ